MCMLKKGALWCCTPLLGTERGLIHKVAMVHMNHVTHSEFHESYMAPACQSELLLYKHGSQGRHTVHNQS